MDIHESLNSKIPTVENFPIVNREGKPSPAVLQMMDVLELPHDGTLNSVVKITQEKFFQRKSDGQRKERWEIDEVIPHLREKAMPVFDKLGMLKEFFPSERKYESALMLGALLPSIRKRLNYLGDLWENGIRFDKIVFLGGERPLEITRENQDALLDKNNPDLLTENDWQAPEKLPTTELEMMKFVWNQGKLPHDLKQIQTQWINAPLKSNSTGEKLLRPTTEDTIKIWLKNNPAERKMLAISNNPHIGYQQSVLKTYLPKDYKIETVGSAASSNLSLAYYLGEMSRWLYQEQIRLQK
jgi:hypothetical protein